MSQIDIVNSHNDTSVLSKFNPLYGPGTLLGWYFTVIAVITTWLLHPIKHQSDIMTVDLVAVSTLPSVAALHFIRLVHNQKSWLLWEEPWTHTRPRWDESLRREQFAAFAPFTIMRAFLPISLILFIVSRPMRFVKRSAIIIWIAVVCASLLIMFSHMFLRWVRGPIDRVGGLIRITWLSWQIIAAPMSFLSVVALLFRRGPNLIETGDVATSQVHVPSPIEEIILVFNLMVPTMGVSVSTILTIGILVPDPGAKSWRSKALTLFVPQSNSSLNDLDQIVAACAGASVLLFNICSAVLSLRNERLERHRRQRHLVPNETTSLTRTQQERPELLASDLELGPMRNPSTVNISRRERGSTPCASEGVSNGLVHQREADSPRSPASDDNQRPRGPFASCI